MKSVKYIYGLTLAAVAMASAFSSCRFEEDDFFEDSAALRIQKFNEEVGNILTSAENGWVMQFYTLDETCGYNFYCKFYPGGQVTVAGSHSYLPRPNVFTEYSSIYSLLREDGAVLSFCSWNDIISIFADPNQKNPSTGRLGEGMGGDYNFIILSASEDEIVMRGQRHNAQVRLVKCPTTWEEYRAAATATSTNFFNRRVAYYYMVSNGDTLYASGMTDGVLTIVDNIDDPMETSQAPFVTTPNGIYLERTYKQNGNSVQELVMNADSTAFISADRKFAFSPAWEIYSCGQITGNRSVQITEEGACPAFQQAYMDLSSDISTIFRHTFEGLTLGTSNDSPAKNRRTGVVVSTKKALTPIYGAYTASIVYNVDEVTFDINLADPSPNISSYAVRPQVKEKLEALVGFFRGTFTVTPNSIFNPTSALLVSKDDPEVYFTIKYSK